MEAGREQAEARADGDAVCAALAGTRGDITEEPHHDESLPGRPRVVGTARAEVLARPPAPTWRPRRAQYYWLLHYPPVALLAYIAVSRATRLAQLVDDLQSRTGYDASALPRCLVTHAELGSGHREELDELLDSLPLTRRPIVQSWD